MNRLSTERSPYLRHAASQEIDWHPWGEKAFEKAEREGKPIFLSSGAVWCHWCHVMAKECFENKEIARLLNDNFISIKIDRDERPDIDRRYQRAVSAMGSGGGWPLSVFLTPDEKPFFGGTYFPPEDGFGRPGFKRVLKTVAELYQSKKSELTEYGRKLLDSLKPKPVPEGRINESLIKRAVASIISQFDPQNGGFGSAPKFPMPGALEFLINAYFFTGDELAGLAARKTLESMAKGGIRDQIGGGFHRYSVDAEWIIPHFEKMADDNAWLMRNYIDAYSVFGNKLFRDVALGIIHYTRDVLSDPQGGFYASQDADIVPEDEGGYFTWTEADFRRVLDTEEYKILSAHLLNDRGSMHHDESKKVLFVSMDTKQIAEKMDMAEKMVSATIERGKRKLLEERKRRTAPFIDRTFYTSLNGMLISAYLKAFRALGEREIKDFALLSLDLIMKDYFVHNELFHTGGVKAVFDDYIYLTDALIAAYEVTGAQLYLDQAEKLMELSLNKFWDKEEGGFFDTEGEIIGMRLKGVEDIPHPSANSLGIIVLLKLSLMTGNDAYRGDAEKSLMSFSYPAKNPDIQHGYYFCAVDAYFHMLKLTLQVSPTSGLTETALSSFSPYLTVLYDEDKGNVIPCVRDVCYEPINKPEDLKDFLKNLAKLFKKY
jgi:uncharacterized protein YyaL (SSP411 family)